MGEKPKTDLKESFANGVAVVKGHLAVLPAGPGVYRMLDGNGKALYVGKAKSLKKRVGAYAKPERLSVRLQRMVSLTRSMEFVTTHTEAEALLLEANLIKRLGPRYNILLRDDKSFPSILVTTGHPYPQVLKHRGAKRRKGSYFGPFAATWAVNETINVLQRAFLLRTCPDSVFAHRRRPCLLYQIKRCAGPCVGRIGEQDYAALVDQARDFLGGGSRKIQNGLVRLMEAASRARDYEAAAGYRDRIRALTRIQAHQHINSIGLGDVDVMAAHQAGGQTCVQVFFFRGGRNFGNRSYFPVHARDDGPERILEAFIGQFYQTRPPPPLVLVGNDLAGRTLLAEALSVAARTQGQGKDRRVRVMAPRRGDKKKLVDQVRANAAEALARRLAGGAARRKLLAGLARTFALDGPPDRIEVYDNSHVSGSDPRGAMIVAGPDGWMKSAYRTFKFRQAKPGDDYAMMREILTRRFSRALEKKSAMEEGAGGNWPDLVLIDGGGGHLSLALGVFEELGISDQAVAAISKGPKRTPGAEKIHLPGKKPFTLDCRDPVFYFLQRLRDEAHRFAIGAHRAGRSKSQTRSTLDGVPGIGPKRKKALLTHFGSAGAVSEAGIDDLAMVDGLSKSMANKIYDWFH